MMMWKKHKWLFFAFITLITWGIWGEFSELIQKEGLSSESVYIVWALSMIPCAVVALSISRWHLDHSLTAIGLGMAIGLLGAGGQLLLFQSLRYGPAYIVFPFVSMSPVVTIALSLFILKERANTLQTIGIIIALIAIFFLSLQDQNGPHTSNKIWLVLAIIVFTSWGIQGFVMKVANRLMSAESIFFYMALGGVVLIPIAFQMLPSYYLSVSNSLWIKGFFTQILNSIGALTLVYAYRYGKAIIVSPMQGLAPLITMVLSLIIFAVIPGTTLFIGLILATLALVLLSLE